MTEQERYQALEQEKQNALSNSNNTYENLLNQNTQYSNGVNEYLNKYQQTQNAIYDKQTQFQVDFQNQNKEKAEKEYQQEAIASKNAYYDFVNPYGIQREIEAQNGLNNAGYSETVKSQAWTTQQNRTAQARASMNEAKLQFDNAIKEAYLNNDVNKANLALQILQQQQEEALRNFNYVSDTKQNQLSNIQNLNSVYANRYDTLYNQIQQEKATAEAIRQWEAEMAEKQRQYNESLAYQQEQDKIAQQQWEKEYQLNKYNTYNNNSSPGGIVLDNTAGEPITENLDSFGNNANTQKLEDYYFKSTTGEDYQPRYIRNIRLQRATTTDGKNLKYGDLGIKGTDIKNDKNIWTTGDGKYYVWKKDQYYDVTEYVK